MNSTSNNHILKTNIQEPPSQKEIYKYAKFVGTKRKRVVEDNLYPSVKRKLNF